MVTTISARHGLFTPPGPAGTLFLPGLPGLPGGGPTVRDRGPLGCTGTITGARWVCLPGGLRCLDFDGSDDYVNFAGVLPTAGITGNQLGVHLWVRPAGTITSERTFIEARDKFVLRGLATNKLNCRLYLDGSWTGQIELADNSLASGAWNAVGLSYDGAVVCLYLNGQPETPSNSSQSGSFNGAASLFRLGVDVNVNYDFAGQMALVRVYGRALSALEFRHLYDSEKGFFRG